jgi:hypothetical protein
VVQHLPSKREALTSNSSAGLKGSGGRLIDLSPDLTNMSLINLSCSCGQESFPSPYSKQDQPTFPLALVAL